MEYYGSKWLLETVWTPLFFFAQQKKKTSHTGLEHEV